MKVPTAKIAFELNTPQLSILKKDAGENVLRAFLVEALSDLIMFFNVGKTVNPHQLVQVVELITDNYYYLRPSELKYCFNQAKIGRYGKLYDRIDGSIIFEWIEKYLLERDEVIYQKNIHLQKQTTQENINVFESLSKLNIDLKQFVEPIKKEDYKNNPQTDFDIKIQVILNEFDELFKQQDEGKLSGIRFVKYKDKMMNIETYTNIRLNEN
jgi:hypothetical protein